MNSQRFALLDALRGLAMVWMTVFHFVFDLNHAGLVKQDFYRDPFWTWQRVVIVSLFLFCAGFGQAVATAQGQSWERFWKRWRQVAACALLVSAGSWLMYPQTFIYFGVLHGMALMLVVVRLTAYWGRWLWLLGALAVASKFIAAYALSVWARGQFIELFNSPVLNWLGWITQKPITEDYAPLFPWLGVMWWGVATEGWLLSRTKANRSGYAGMALPRALPKVGRALAVLGRWSLSYYMVHQPVLIAMVMGLGWLKR
ncbi:MAG: heparan-alpha-glucosaminide N-acetyltransferase [Rhodoferax sp.]|uniref:DUF1624 domain-containing protein n=1 Tax=Rhodoferax sp. TaxID=50421 RepID=UPI002628500B|nr:heparan-alpha-glucosaminide N-acetyltransferase [Rhodoferax sp.]MDD2882340.1 heparan-alpha-glucosaminide N-acetyltransferase [Rhodoferax sp.]